MSAYECFVVAALLDIGSELTFGHAVREPGLVPAVSLQDFAALAFFLAGLAKLVWP